MIITRPISTTLIIFGGEISKRRQIPDPQLVGVLRISVACNPRVSNIDAHANYRVDVYTQLRDAYTNMAVTTKSGDENKESDKAGNSATPFCDVMQN